MPNTPPAASASLAAAQNLANNASNLTTTKSLLSSSRDLLSVPLRAIYRADTYAFSTLPRQVAKFVGLGNVAAQLMDDTTASGGAVGGETVARVAAETVGEGAAGAATAATTGQESGFHIADFFHTLRRLSGFFSYLTSRWSLACFTVVSADNLQFGMKTAGSNRCRLLF